MKKQVLILSAVLSLGLASCGAGTLAPNASVPTAPTHDGTPPSPPPSAPAPATGLKITVLNAALLSERGLTATLAGNVLKLESSGAGAVVRWKGGYTPPGFVAPPVSYWRVTPGATLEVVDPHKPSGPDQSGWVDALTIE